MIALYCKPQIASDTEISLHRENVALLQSDFPGNIKRNITKD